MRLPGADLHAPVATGMAGRDHLSRREGRAAFSSACPPAGRTVRYLHSLTHRLRCETPSCDLVCVSTLRHEAYAVVRALRGRVPILVRAESAGVSGDCRWHETACWGTRIRRRCQQADAVLCPTPQVRNELETAGFPATRIRDVTQGVPLPPSRSPDAQWARPVGPGRGQSGLRRSLGGLAGRLHGKLDIERSLPTLLAAFEELAARRSDVRFWIVGQHPFSAGTARRDRIARASRAGS